MKSWLIAKKNAIFWGTILILAVILSFGLGYFAGRKEGSRSPIIIEKCSKTIGAN